MYKTLWEQAAIGWDVGILVTEYGSRPVPFPRRSYRSSAPFLLFARRGKPRPFDTLIITESPVFTGLAPSRAGSFFYY